MGPPLAISLPTCLWKTLKSMPLSLPTPLSMEKVHGWYLCHPGGKTQSTITMTHQLTGPTYTVYHRGTKPRRSPTFPGHLGFPRSQQHSSHHCLQKAKKYWPGLHWHSSHFITAKNSVFNTLPFRAKVVCTSQHALYKEMEHIRKALQACNFPPRAFSTLQSKCNHIHNTPQWTNNQFNNPTTATTMDQTTKTCL